MSFCYFCDEAIELDDDTNIYKGCDCHNSCLEEAIESGKICPICGELILSDLFNGTCSLKCKEKKRKHSI